MRLEFLDRENERSRLAGAFVRQEGSFCCLYGRRRCGKSRLLQEVLPNRSAVYYVGDEREPSLQRAALAAAVSTVVPGFDQVTYPDWTSLLVRWWRDAPRGTVLALDEFPYLVSGSRELPSILQKLIDQHKATRLHLVVSGSAQRMMHGLVLDTTAPLYGRAQEIINVGPLGAAWVSEAFKHLRGIQLLEVYSLWGGIPHYWELALDRGSNWEAVQELVLDPLGVLHAEPSRLLLDDLRETAQAASVLSLIGRGCNRISEIAARMEKPVTSLTRPLSRLLELGLVHREQPFGFSEKSSKKSLYKILDPFLAFWFRFVEPNRSRLEAGALKSVAREIERDIATHYGEVWETLVRCAVPRLPMEGIEWRPAHRWWGGGTDKNRLEVDVVAESIDGRTLLVGEARLTIDAGGLARARQELKRKTARLPFVKNYERVVERVFAAETRARRDTDLITAADVFRVLT
ncbi:MAG: ATP-binding protein [Candidatus Eisenbacteria bacterium]|nr:ATP-binding protein [Candidatus Eisenbacteria bacterium]